MQALMLAAGMGKRLGAYTNNQTKCMVQVGGRTLLEHAAEALRQAGIRKFTLVVGYEGEKLKAFAREKLADFDLTFVENPDYAATNNIYSLYLAREVLTSDDTILLESDLIYEPRLIRELMDFDAPNVVAVAKYRPWMDGTMTLVDENGVITEFVEKRDFRFDRAEEYCKTVNVYKFSRSFSADQYEPFLSAYIRAYGDNQYYEMVLKALAHLPFAGLRAYELGDIKWYEIDDAQDLDIANTLFAPPAERLHAYGRHFGGYWRYDRLRDFCYLVNPYYPPRKMQDQMRYMYDALLTQYPSGMADMRLLAGKMFGIKQEHILVGNGAAELINTLGRILSGKTAVTLPAFNEYVRCFPDCAFTHIPLAETGYCFDLHRLREAAASCGNLILVNPDNPTGAFLAKNEVLELCEITRAAGSRLIVDESFVDFAAGEKRFTLLEDDILSRFPNLVVVKSISKSYGVPGLRLGVVASADTELLARMKDLLPVWNINSFAEYFLQVSGLYAGSYAAACDRIAENRQGMIERLASYPFLTPCPSEANYVMCRVEGMTSKALADKLLERDILIKDLAPKDGFGGESFVRIAVRDEADNEALYAALDELG